MFDENLDMNKLIIGLLSGMCFFTCFTSSAQGNIWPANGQKIHFTELMLEHPAVTGASIYRITVVKKVSGKFQADPVVVRINDSTPATRITRGLEFGHTYLWRYEALNKLNKPIFTSDVFRFSISTSPLLDSLLQRVAVVKPCKEECEDGIVFIDGLNIAVNRQGIPKWFVPGETDATRLMHYRDLHLSRSGTLLFMNNDGAFETDLSGRVLWKTHGSAGRKIKEKEERYHHAFDKDAQLRYMICGRKNITDPDALVNGQMLFQYDTAGNEIWRFDVTDAVGERFGIYPPQDTVLIYTLGHLNGFAIDHKNELMYASFRDFNSIFQVDIKSRKIVAVWGNKNISYKEKNEYDDHLFAAQHSPVLLKNGNILVFNNNVSDRSSSIVELAPEQGDQVRKVWEYVLEEHVNESPYGSKIHSDKMGIASELPNENILVGMGQLNRIFEITRNKTLVWEIYPEKRKDTSLPWGEAPSYRVSYASSLYPSYFTIDHRNASQQIKAGESVLIRVNNEGTADDEYTVELVPEEETIPYYQTAIHVGKETSAHLSVKVIPATLLTKPVKVKVKVTAASNPVKTRELVFEAMP